MTYSRQNPSPRYRELLEQYQIAHRDGLSGKPAEATFDGRSLAKELHKIRDLVRLTGARTLLDYGCGKALLYQKRNFKTQNGDFVSSVPEYLGLQQIRLFDPGIPELSDIPHGTFDGVICVDVLEHCPASDVPWILDELFGKADKFVFANVASFPANKTLANGENAHCTQMPPEWWGPLLVELSKRHPGKLLRFEIGQIVETPEGKELQVTILSNIR